ncbi:MAG: hypothetical protein SGARI_005282, partial [Bacillariaceae sp.]
MEKGRSIRFVKGKYAGYEGWEDKSKRKKKGSRYRPVIIKLEEKEKKTSVLKTSFRSLFHIPSTLEEAALQQHPDLELAMINLAGMFAQI